MDVFPGQETRKRNIFSKHYLVLNNWIGENGGVIAIKRWKLVWPTKNKQVFWINEGIYAFVLRVLCLLFLWAFPCYFRTTALQQTSRLTPHCTCNWGFLCRLICVIFDEFIGNNEHFFDRNVHLIKDISSII